MHLYALMLPCLGPQGIGFRSRENEAPLEAGMMVTDGRPLIFCLKCIFSCSVTKYFYTQLLWEFRIRPMNLIWWHLPFRVLTDCQKNLEKPHNFIVSIPMPEQFLSLWHWVPLIDNVVVFFFFFFFFFCIFRAGLLWRRCFWNPYWKCAACKTGWTAGKQYIKTRKALHRNITDLATITRSIGDVGKGRGKVNRVLVHLTLRPRLIPIGN